ncbi:helix-turn-helix domain-containing protein [Agromyces sp. NPDC058484]|uniref:AraC family transcriptional regulator n=1 Tax=Agromyces sp. NPDC058484 TaxID=3346524 RepID=UPI0036573624
MYRLHPPAESLRSYIENYWFVSHVPGEDVHLRVDVFVDARADLIFNFEAPYRREVIGGGGSEHDRSNLDAQRLVPIRILQHGAVRIVGVRFHLGGLAPFTRASIAPWSGRTPAPELVFGDGIRELESDLRTTDFEASARMIDDFFLGRLRLDGAQATFERALSALVAGDGRVLVNELADVAASSPRQVERLFARGLGFPPKTVGRVLRFQCALRQLMTDPGVPLGEVAANAGYYDQAHFVRDFRVFSGGVPRGYRGHYPPEVPNDFAPNVVVFVQDVDPPERRDWSGPPDPRTRGGKHG